MLSLAIAQLVSAASQCPRHFSKTKTACVTISYKSACLPSAVRTYDIVVDMHEVRVQDDLRSLEQCPVQLRALAQEQLGIVSSLVHNGHYKC